MRELTEHLPKPMLQVLGENLLEHKIKALPPSITEVIFVTGYKSEVIREHFGKSWGGKNISYAFQSELRGTGDSLHKAKHLLGERFLVCMGDDLYSPADFENCLKYPWALLAKETTETLNGAKIILDDLGRLKEIVEAVELKAGDFNNAGLYTLGREIFEYPLVALPNGEFGLPQTIAKVAKDFEIKVVESKGWHQISSPEDLERVEKMFGDRKDRKPTAC